MNLPPLPSTWYLLYLPSDGYDNDMLTQQDGYDADAMKAYAEAAALAERERCIEVAKALGYAEESMLICCLKDGE